MVFLLPYFVFPLVLALLVRLPFSRRLRPHAYVMLIIGLAIWPWIFDAMTQVPEPTDTEPRCAMPQMGKLFAFAFGYILLLPTAVLAYFTINRVADRL